MNFSPVTPRATIGAISVKVPKLYNLAMYSAKMPILWEVCVKGVLNEKSNDITVTISADCEQGELISSCSFTYPQKSIYNSNIDYRNKDFYAALCFEDIAPHLSKQLLQDIKKHTKAQIRVEITVENQSAVYECAVDLYPYNVWHGLGFNPLITAAYVLPSFASVSQTVKSLESPALAKSNPVGLLRELYKRLKQKKLVYERASDNYTFERAVLCLSDNFYNKQLGMYTPIELALFFASCAERIGLKPVVCFFKGESGNSLCFAGARISNSVTLPMVCEQKDKIWDLIKQDKIILFEPASFSAGHQTDFESAVRSAKLKILSDELSLLCLFDIASARQSGIYPMSGNNFGSQKDDSKGETALLSKKLALHERQLYKSQKLKILTNFFNCDNKKLPLFMPDFDSFVALPKQKDQICSCPDWVNLSVVGAIDKDFCSLYAQSGNSKDVLSLHGAGLSLNISQEKEMESAIHNLRTGLYSENVLYSPLSYEEFMSCALSEYALKQGKDICIMAGFAKLEKEGKTTIYPLIIYKGQLKHESGRIYFEYACEPVLFNYPAIKEIVYATSQTGIFSEFERADHDIGLYISAFQKLCGYVNASGGTNSLEIIKEAYICNFDTDAYYKWLDFTTQLEQYSHNKSLKSLVLGTEPENIPQYSDSKSRSENSCFLSPYLEDVCDVCNCAVSGRRSSGKKSLLVSMLKRNIEQQKTSLVFVNSQNRADDILHKAGSLGIEKRILPLYGQHLSKASLLNRALGLCETKKEIESSKALKNKGNSVYDYELAIHKKYNFGLSFYDCVFNYRDYLLRCGEMTKKPEADSCEVDIMSLDKDGFSDLLCCADNLVNTASAANAAISRLKALSLDSHPLYCLNIENSFSLGKEIKEAFCELSQNVCYIKPRIKQAAELIGFEASSIKTVAQLCEFSAMYHAAVSKPVFIMSARGNPKEAVEDLKQKKYAVTRIRSIEQILSFLRPEALEQGLPERARSMTDAQAKSFMERKNIKKEAFDACSDFVFPERKSDFMKMPIADIFALCDEYKQRKAVLSSLDTKEYDIVCASCDVYDEIYRCAAKLDLDSSQISRIFDSVYKMHSDEEEAKSFALCLKDTCTIMQRLISGIGFAPWKFSYEGGIFDGENDLSKRICDAYVSLDGFEKWCDWCFAKKAANAFGLGFFAVHIEKHGLGPHTREAFYAVLYKCAGKAILNDIPKELWELDINAKFVQNDDCVWDETIEHELSKDLVNQLQNPQVLLEDVISSDPQQIKKLFPVIIADSEGLSLLEYGSRSFDFSYVYDAHTMSILDCAPAVCAAKEFLLFGCHTTDKRAAINCSAIKRYDLDHLSYHTKGEISTLCDSLYPQKTAGNGVHSVNREEAFELLFAEGRFDRAETRTNLAEIRLLADCLRKKYTGICASDAKLSDFPTVNVMALTDEQRMATLLYFTRRESREDEIAKAMESGLINIVPFDNSSFISDGEIVLMTVFARDSQGINPMQTTAEIDGFDNLLFGVLQNCTQKITVITSLEKEPTEQSFCSKSMLLLLRLIKSCADKVIYSSPSGVRKAKPNRHPLALQAAEDIMKKPEYAGYTLNTLCNVADIEAINQQKKPAEVFFIDKPYMCSLNKILWDMRQYKNAGYKVKYISIKDLFIN